MCGIVGVLFLKDKSININCAQPMTDVIAHRGPDDAGYLFFHTGCRHSKKISFYLNLSDKHFSTLAPLLPPLQDENVQRELKRHDWDLFLGHRRLAILDLSPTGHQPMSDLSKNIWIVYNGEIYNFKEIRKELEKKGHKFLSNTDTEVIIYGYIEWGIKCIEKFNGMFAFALYDNFKKKLYLVRDRYGIKPLYYTILPNFTLIFANEIKAILKYSDYKSRLDKKALLEYFTFQNIFTDRTFWKGIKILPPGHYLEVDLQKPQISLIKYWDFCFTNPEIPKKEEEYIEELDRLFEQAVRRQLIADVEIGSYLSGGIDSGSITAIVSKHFSNFFSTEDNCLKTFTIGFDLHSASGIELTYDEREKSEYMSYLFKTEHYEMVLKSGDMERCLRDLVYHLEEPRVGQSYPNYYAAKLASRFVKVVLAGTGGDELFGGYPWRYYRALNCKDFEDYVDRYYKFWKRLIPNRYLWQMFAPIKDEVKDVWTRDIFRDVLIQGISKNSNIKKLSDEDFLNISLYFEAKTFLHGLLVVEDKLSMAHSLETRVPFLDNELVEFAMKVPVRLKLKNIDNIKRLDENEIGKLRKTNDGKVILRKVLSKYVPEKIYNAQKQGFSSPDNSWFKGDSIEFVKRKILNKNAKIYQFFDYKTVEGLVKEHLEGKINRRLFIWSLLYFEEWLEVYGGDEE